MKILKHAPLPAMAIIVTTTMLLAFSSHSFAVDPDRIKADGYQAEPRKPVQDVPQVQIKPNFTVTAELPDVPPELPTYAVVPVDLQKIAVKSDRLAHYFKFIPETRGEDTAADGTKSVMYTGPKQRSLEYFSSGAIFFMNEQLFDERAPDLFKQLGIDQASAKPYFSTLSNEFMRSNDLLSKNMHLKDISFATVSSMARKSGSTSDKVVGASAHYEYTLAGVPAWGPGAKSAIYFDEQGISGYYRAMPALKSVGSAKTLPAEQIVSQYIENGQAQTLYRLHAGAVSQVNIDSVKLVYFVDAGNTTQKSVTPHYLLSGTMIGQDLSTPGAAREVESDFVWLASAI